MHSVLIPTTDPTLNLALEELLFTRMSTDSPGYFLLWHNAPSIIVGRHQNTAAEINKELVEKYNLPVVRRMTGGGAVYHDLGNVNFSFLRPLRQGESGHIDFTIFLQPIVETLQALGVDASFTSRNDITCGERKLSGSAQLRRAGKVLHHGTLLVDLDLDMLGAVLMGAPDKYLSKGIASIRSRVANLREFLPASVTMESIKDALVQRCAPEIIELDAALMDEAQLLAEEKYRTRQWNYVLSPPFTAMKRERFPWGLVECHVEVQKGSIRRCKFFGDFFAATPIESLESLLQGIAYQESALHEALAHIPLEKYFSGCDRQQMYAFLCKIP